MNVFVVLIDQILVSIGRIFDQDHMRVAYSDRLDRFVVMEIHGSVYVRGLTTVVQLTSRSERKRIFI